MNETPRVSGSESSSAPIDMVAALAAHDRWLRTVVAARVGEPQAVDEVMQEVSLAAVAGKSRPADPAKVTPWLYRVAVMQSLLHRRKAGRRRKLVDGFSRHQEGVGSDSRELDPLAWLLADERQKLVRLALSKMPRRDAELLLLKYTEDWSYRQIAERLGLSESAVEARLHRARGRMRQLLAEMHVIEART